MRTLQYATGVVLGMFLLGGCPTNPGLIGPSWLDGSWWLDYSESPNPTRLTFTDGRVTSELGGGFEPVEILWANTATISGNRVSWSYGSRQTLLIGGVYITFQATGSFDGTIQDDGSVAGTMTTSGTANGVPLGDTDAFIMWRV
jgi:hypothetical protein